MIHGYFGAEAGSPKKSVGLSCLDDLFALIQAIHAELKGAYGSPRMVRELRARGFPASKARVERLMQRNGIRARHKRHYRATTNSRHGLPVAPNLLDRRFRPAAPTQVWTSDITYLWTDEGWLYRGSFITPTGAANMPAKP